LHDSILAEAKRILVVQRKFILVKNEKIQKINILFLLKMIYYSAIIGVKISV